MKQLIRQVCDEFKMAEEYIECAAHSEGDDKDTYRTIGKDELNHAEKLIVLGDSHVASMTEDSKHKIIWEFKREEFKNKLVKLKAEISVL